MQQYLILMNAGYAEGATLTNLVFFCLVDEQLEHEVTPLYIANRFKAICNLYLEEEEYPNDLKELFSWISDNSGCLWELLETNGLMSKPDLNIPISKVIYLDEIVNYITDCNLYSFKNMKHDICHYFTEEKFK